MTFIHKFLYHIRKQAAVMMISALTFSQIVVPVEAAHVAEAVTSSALDTNWPTGPSVTSETAILIEASTGTILYEKNAHQQMYPASITKILTTLIAYETSDLDEQVTFTQATLDTIPYDSSRIWVDRGNYMDMEDCLAAILIMSANDVAAGVAEHIGGTLDDFADIMNERAKELGCLNSHFVNAHGYHDPDHYTTAYDMAQIGRAFFDVDLLCTLSRERNFKHGPTDGQPKAINEFNTNKLLATRSYEYEYLVGAKTGYTSDAGQTLVSCAQKDGMKLICVVMNAVSPNQYKDTISLFDFGFSNFTTANISEHDDTYVSADTSYGANVVDVLGDSTPLLSMNTDSIIVLPKSASFADTTSYITTDADDESCMAVAHYQYGTHDIGTAQIYVTTGHETIVSDPEQTTGSETAPIEPIEQPSEAPVDVEIVKKKLIPPVVWYVILGVFVCAVLVTIYRIYMKAARSKAAARRRRAAGSGARPSSPNVFQMLFIGFAQLLQGLWYMIIGRFTSANKRKRYKKRGSASVMSHHDRSRNVKIDTDLRAGRAPSKEYYKNSTPNKPKNVTFHDLNTPKK